MMTFGILGGAEGTWHPLAIIRYSLNAHYSLKLCCWRCVFNSTARNRWTTPSCSRISCRRMWTTMATSGTVLRYTAVTSQRRGVPVLGTTLILYTCFLPHIKIIISTQQFDDVRVISGPLWLPGDRPSKLEVKYDFICHYVATVRLMKLSGGLETWRLPRRRWRPIRSEKKCELPAKRT